MRNKRWDYLYDRQAQPVKEFILERFIRELAEELRSWPPPFIEWVSDELRTRYAIGLESPPPERVMRYALRVARLELANDYDAIDRAMQGEASAHWQTAADKAAGHLLVRFVTEKMLSLKEYAEGAKITRRDLVASVDALERTLFLVAVN